MLGFKIFVQVQFFRRRPFAQLLHPAGQYVSICKLLLRLRSGDKWGHSSGCENQEPEVQVYKMFCSTIILWEIHYVNTKTLFSQKSQWLHSLAQLRYFFAKCVELVYEMRVSEGRNILINRICFVWTVTLFTSAIALFFAKCVELVCIRSVYQKVGIF